MNIELLKYHIKINDGNIENLAKAMNFSRQTIYNKMNEKDNEFKRSEIDFIANRYNLSVEEINRIFFAHSVS